MSEIGKLVRAARERRGWSQEKLASTAGVSQTTIDKIEQGKTLKSRFLSNIALALNVPLEEIDVSLLSPKIASDEDYGYFNYKIDGEDVRVRRSPDVPLYVSTEYKIYNEISINDSPAELVWRPRILDHSKDAYAILITFPFMRPELEEGDTAFFDSTFPLRPGSTGCFLRKPFIERIAKIARLIDVTETSYIVRIWQSAANVTIDKSEWSEGARLVCKYTRR